MRYTLVQQKIILFYLFANLLTLQIRLISEIQQCKKLSPINKIQDTRYKIQDTDEIVMIK